MVNGKMLFREVKISVDINHPVMELLVVDSDQCVLNSALIMPENLISSSSSKAWFSVYQARGKENIELFKDPRKEPVTVGKSPIVSMLFSKFDQKEVFVRGLLAMAILDHCFILKDLIGISVEAPTFTFRDQNKVIDNFVKRSLNFF